MTTRDVSAVALVVVTLSAALMAASIRCLTS
jgi:hypothetical protein